MPKEFKPGWEYLYSETLGQEVAHHLASGGVYCADGVKYKPEEIAIMGKAGAEITQGIHMVKSLFRGTIVESLKRE